MIISCQDMAWNKCWIWNCSFVWFNFKHVYHPNFVQSVRKAQWLPSKMTTERRGGPWSRWCLWRMSGLYIWAKCSRLVCVKIEALCLVILCDFLFYILFKLYHQFFSWGVITCCEKDPFSYDQWSFSLGYVETFFFKLERRKLTKSSVYLRHCDIYHSQPPAHTFKLSIVPFCLCLLRLMGHVLLWSSIETRMVQAPAKMNYRTVGCWGKTNCRFGFFRCCSLIFWCFIVGNLILIVCVLSHQSRLCKSKTVRGTIIL